MDILGNWGSQVRQKGGEAKSESFSDKLRYVSSLLIHRQTLGSQSVFPPAAVSVATSCRDSAKVDLDGRVLGRMLPEPQTTREEANKETNE